MFQLPLRLMDLSFAADTSTGLHILMQPSVRSKQAQDPDGLVWLRFHPDTVLEWINGAAQALQVPAPNARADGIQWSRVLLPLGGRGAVSVGRERKQGKLQKGHWLAIADSLTGWRAEMDRQEADSLLKLLLAVGSRAYVATGEAAVLEAEAVDQQAAMIDQQTLPKLPGGRKGRVALSYVVGADGVVEPGTAVAYVVSDPDLAPLALVVVRSWRFNPARKGGLPVRQLVRQSIVWR
jgi:hypothetical protein